MDVGPVRGLAERGADLLGGVAHHDDLSVRAEPVLYRVYHSPEARPSAHIRQQFHSALKTGPPTGGRNHH
jgi:hypothetical protein